MIFNYQLRKIKRNKIKNSYSRNKKKKKNINE